MTNGKRLTPESWFELSLVRVCSSRTCSCYSYSYSSPPLLHFLSSSPDVSLPCISLPSPLSPKIFPPLHLCVVLFAPLPHLFPSFNSRHLCNPGIAATAPFYSGLYNDPLRVLYPALRSPVTLCSTCLESCPTNPASLSAPFAPSTSPCSSSHSSKACFRSLLGASHRRSAETLIFAYTHHAHR
jgi:hypothetical protein